MEDLLKKEKEIKNDLKNAHYEELFSRRNEQDHEIAKEKIQKLRHELAKIKTRIYEERNGIKR